MATAQKSDRYSFTVGRKKFYLPPASVAASKLPGRFLRDAVLDGDDGELRMNFAMVEAAGVDQETIDALYGLPAADMMGHINNWMLFKPSEDDVSLGESSASDK